MPSAEKVRCSWCGDDPLYIRYHDEEWGVPVHDDRKLFEMLLLEGFQAGLSWITILRKRENFRKAFRGFDPEKISRFTRRDLERLMLDAGIVRNRLKIEGSVLSAKAHLAVRKEFGTFDRFIWQFKDQNQMSKELLRRGFKFVGPTICYAFMQAVGMVNDHAKDCWKYSTTSSRPAPSREGGG
jgi:DNA-3-methyladenine glycosylase I